jgi:hypothetical protein
MADKDNIELMLAQALGEWSATNKQISSTLDNMSANLKTLNDNNILHQTRQETEHREIISSIQLLTGKYWYLIIGLLVVVLVVLGYKEAATHFIG